MMAVMTIVTMVEPFSFAFSLSFSFSFPRLCAFHMLDCPLRRCSVDPADLTVVVQADSKSPVVWSKSLLLLVRI